MNRRSRQLFQTPFGRLTSHFGRRLFAQEDEATESELNFGLGAVLALLAAPGAFASLFLLDKYSTLLQWMRGQRIDAIHRSPADEYFFVVLSMTVTGLVMVSRWNRLFPDRRDFANLAVLPIPIRNVFLANLTALLGLAFVFAIDVNAVSALLFPFFVTLSYGTAASFWTVALGHALSVIAASFFSFFGVFAAVGVLTLAIPSKFFRPVSVLFRIGLVVLLMAEFFGKTLLRVFQLIFSGNAAAVAHWIPAYWFLGIYERVTGIATSSMQSLGTRAWVSLCGTICLSLAAYAVSYKRQFLRLPETLDVLGAITYKQRPRLLSFLDRALFRSSYERACAGFAKRALFRSEQHIMFLGAYLAVGAVTIVQVALDSLDIHEFGMVPSSEWLSIPLLATFFVATGLRQVFDTPAARNANWIFKALAYGKIPDEHSITFRLLLLGTLPWQLLLVLPVTAWEFTWRIASYQALFLTLFTFLLVQCLLLNWSKIPFTCVTRIDVRMLVSRLMILVFTALIFIPAMAAWEHHLLERPLRFVFLGMLALLAEVWMRRYRNQLPEVDRSVSFHQSPTTFELLRLDEKT